MRIIYIMLNKISLITVPRLHESNLGQIATLKLTQHALSNVQYLRVLDIRWY